MLNLASGNSSQHVGQQRDRLAAADPGLPDVAPGQLGDRTLPVGDPVQPGVVEGDQLTVRGGVHVGLEVAVPLVDGPPEGRQGVLQAGQVADVPAAMGERPWAAALEKAGHRRSLARPLSRPERPGHSNSVAAGMSSP